LKQSISPAAAGVVIVLVLVVVGFFIWRGASGGAGSKPVGATGNPGPFEPGGAATGKGGTTKPSGAGSGGRPGMPSGG
jgi:hypothetical protein